MPRTADNRGASMRFRSVGIWVITVLMVLGSPAMTAEDLGWDELVEKSMRYAQERQAELERDFDLSRHERWDLDQDTGALVFSNDGVPAVVAEFQFVGSLSDKSGTWLWAWGNSSIEPGLRDELEAVRAFGEGRGFARLTDRKWKAEEVDGWEMAAVTAYLLKARGLYRPPFDGGVSFLVITDIRRAGG